MARQPTRRRYRTVPQPIKSGFTVGNLVNLGAIPILTAMLTVIGFYYQTNTRLERYGEEIVSIKKVVADKTNEDNVQREKVREAFLKSQDKTNDGISKLDTRLAIAETQQKIANDALAKINETLQRISNFSNHQQRR